MKIIQCDQGGAEWFEARMGIVTASCVADIVTPAGKRKVGAAPRRYMLDLLAERLTREPTESYTSAAMERGTELEPRARAYYEMATGRDVRQVGFVRSDCGRWGCSPDGLCEDRGIEIKCPLRPGFMDVAESLAVPDEHTMQMQFCMWVTGLARWDYVCYTNVRGLSPIIIETHADAKLHAAFAEIVPAFCADLDAAESRFRAAGHGWTPPPPDEGPTWEELTTPRNIG